jgi:hypothetical protein
MMRQLRGSLFALRQELPSGRGQSRLKSLENAPKLASMRRGLIA